MPAPFDDPAPVEHQDLVGVPHGGKPVGNDKAGALLHQALESLLDLAFGLGVNAGGCLVEDEHRRVFEEIACKGDTLFFADSLFAAALS